MEGIAVSNRYLHLDPTELQHPEYIFDVHVMTFAGINKRFYKSSAMLILYPIRYLTYLGEFVNHNISHWFEKDLMGEPIRDWDNVLPMYKKLETVDDIASWIANANNIQQRSDKTIERITASDKNQFLDPFFKSGLGQWSRKSLELIDDLRPLWASAVADGLVGPTAIRLVAKSRPSPKRKLSKQGQPRGGGNFRFKGDSKEMNRLLRDMLRQRKTAKKS